MTINQKWTWILAAAIGAAAGCAAADQAASDTDSNPPAAPEATQPPSGDDDTWTVKRIAGDMQATVSFDGRAYRFGSMAITTPLPEGYPAPTPPAAIELKKYPAVRRAQVTSSKSPDRGMNSAFWPLFQHIKRRDIAMTSPVEMDYPGIDDPQADAGEWTMSFLYRTADLGPTGNDRDGVVVVDVPPMTVVAIGFKGGYGYDRAKRELQSLETWLAASTDWERAGEPRAMYYNGPEKWAWDKWGEVQIPVRRRTPPPAEPMAPENAG